MLMCLFPRFIKNRKYMKNKKNNGIIPTVTDDRVLYVPVGCGKCIECRKQKSRQWQVRLNEEIRIDNSGKFVTLTFDNDSLKELENKIQKESNNYKKIEENLLATQAVRYFLERWRKKYKKSLKHWLITELGHQNTERIHLHGLLFTYEVDDIKKIWKYGNVYIGEWVNEQTVNYIIKYVTKIDVDHKGYEGIILTSAGIGKNYLNRNDSNINKYKGEETQEYYRTRKGLKLNLPIYYRNKIYTENEREKLWLNKLDKNEIWICGEKIDASNDEELNKAREYYQRKNKQLGFGDNSINWSKINYNRQKALIKISKMQNNHKKILEKEQPKEINPKFEIDNSKNEFL